MNREFTRAPHRTPEAVSALPVETAALLIDFDNVTMGIRSNLGQELRNLLNSDVIRSKIAVQRAYADWRRYPQYIVPLSEASIDLIFAPAYGSSKKNATDIRLAIDACELVFTRPEIGTFILLSGDSDFSSLVLKLKEYGKYVIGVGLQESASDILVQNCDEYYSYNQVSGLVSAGEISSEKHDPWVLVSMAVRRMVERNDVMRSDRLKQVMLEIDSSFDEKGAGFAKFNRFLAEATHRDLIEMRKGQNGQYEVAPGSEVLDSGDAPVTEAKAPAGTTTSSGRNRRGGRGRSRSGSASSESKPQPRTGSGGRGGRSKPSTGTTVESTRVSASEGLEGAYDALANVVADLYAGEGVRDSMAKRKLIAGNSGFDEGGLGFAKFSLFLKQAAEDGVVELEQRPDGNFYLSPAPEGKRAAAKPSRSAPATGGAKKQAAAEKPAKRGLLDRLLGKSKPEQTPAVTEPAPQRTARQTPPETPKRESSPPGGRSGQPSRGRSDVGRGDQQESRGGRQGRGDQDRRSAPSSGSGPKGRGSQESRVSQEGRGSQETGSGKESRAGQERRSTGSRGGQRGRGGQSKQTDRQPRDDQKTRGDRDERTSRGSRDAGRASGSRGEQREKRAPREKTPTRSEQPRQETSRKKEPAPTPKPDAPEQESVPVAAESDTTAAQPRRLGRYRSGSRGRPTAKPSGSTASRIGPVSRSATDEPAAKKETDGAAAGRSSRSSDAPKRDAAERDSSSAESKEAGTKPRDTGKSAAPSRGRERARGPNAEAVEHMVRNYAGVGKRTAEVLVDHFGAEVFTVIDSNPGRLTEVLSEGRAKAVVAAREQERAE